MPLTKEELQRAHSTQVNDNADQLVQNNDGIVASGTGLPHPMPVAGPTPAPPISKAKQYVGKELHEAAAPLTPVLTGAPRAPVQIRMGKPMVDVSPVFEAMNRGAEANLARHARGLGAGAQVLLHSEDPAQYQKDVELATRQMMGASEEEYAKIPGWRRAANEFATQMVYDPLTYAGGFGLGEMLAEKITVLGTENVARAIRMMETSANPRMRLAGAGLAKAYDFTHYKGAVQRSLAAKGGGEGVAQFRGLKAINNARRTKGLDLERSLLSQYHDIIQGLSKDEEGQLYQAVHTGKEAELPENLAMRATAFKNVTDQLAHLSGDPEVREKLAQEPGATGFKTSQGSKYTVNPSGTTTRFKAIDKTNHPESEHTFYVDDKTASAILTHADARKIEFPDGIKREGVFEVRDGVLHAIQREKKTGRVLKDQVVQTSTVPTKGMTPVELFSNGTKTHVGHPITEVTGGGQGFVLPDFMKRFEGEEPRGLQNAEQYREHYVPTAHDMKWARDTESPDSILGRDLSKETGSGTDNEVIDQLHLNQPSKSSGERGDERSLQDILENPKETKPGKVESTLNAHDQFLKERREEARLLKPELQRKIIEQRLKSGSRAIAAADAEKAVTQLFGKKTFASVPADAKQFFEETYNAPGGKEFWTGLAKGAIDVPKIGLFALPFRHSANIGSLLALADPLAVPSALGKYVQLLATGTGSKRLSKYIPYLDPQAAAARRAAALGKSYKYGVSGVPSLDRQSAAGWVGHIPVIGDIYKASNHMLWTFDDAAKATRFNRLLKKYQGRGMSESQAAYRAADEVGAELIDYSNRSPLTQALAYILPFATYRSKMPGAILHTAVRHPERIAQVGRASPELVGDLQQAEPNDQGQPQVGKSYLPLAEIMRGITNPAEYARASLGYPAAFTASAVNAIAQRGSGSTDKDVAFYWTYGKDPDLKYLLNATLGSFPGGEAALGAAGLGEFANQGSLSGAIRGQTGFGLSRGPSPTQMHLPELLDQSQAAADAYRKKGDEATAKKIEQAIGDLKQKYRLFIP